MSSVKTQLDRFYTRWGSVVQLVTGAFLIAVAGVVVFVAVSLYSYRSYGDHLVRTQCQRSKEFSPPVADFYEAHHVLGPKTLRDYRATIPKHC
jgi:hypothetical protein